MSKMTKKIVVFAAILGCIGVSNSFGQVSHQAASNLALGGGGAAYLDGYHANFVNPANLMLNEGVKPRFSLGLLGGVSANAGGSLLNVSVYNKYFTSGLTISDQIASDALNKWFGGNPGNMRGAGFQLDVIPLGSSYRSDKWAAGVALRSRMLVDIQFSRGFAELGIYGLDGEIFAEPTPVDLSIEALSFYEASFGYSRKLLTIPSLFGFAENVKVYAGIAPKLLLGAHNSRLNFNSDLLLEGVSQNEIDRIQHEFVYTFETTGVLAGQLKEFYNDRQAMNKVPDIDNYIDPKGEDLYEVKAAGWGFDLGGTVEMDISMPLLGNLFKGKEKLRVGLSLTDIGRVSFKDKVGKFKADDILEWEGFEFDKQTIEDEFNGDREAYMESVLTDSIAAEIYGSFAPQNVEKISRPLPSRMNFGAQLVMNRLSLSLDLGKGFVEKGINSRRLSMSTGIEYRLFGFLPFRAGMRTGGLGSTSYSAGFGLELKNVDFSFAASTVANSENRGAGVGAAWSGIVLRF
ncbi:MAG: DUF5723 family protein [Balneolaceae bacterium]|nr:DUF5723 family protein [Balneolaceae bacterium]